MSSKPAIDILCDAQYRFVCPSPILWVKLEPGCRLSSQILITNVGWSRPLPSPHSVWLLRNASSSSAIFHARIFHSYFLLNNRWATQRIVFGKPLASQPVIRSKLAKLISRIETCQNWFESVTYQMNNVSECSPSSTISSFARYIYNTRNLQMNYRQQSDKLAGPIGLLKQCVYCSVILDVKLVTIN